MKKTLVDTDPEYFQMIMSLNEAAYERVGAPDFIQVLPPRRIRCRATSSMPGALRC